MPLIGVRILYLEMLIFRDFLNLLHPPVPVAQDNVSMYRHLGKIEPVTYKLEGLVGRDSAIFEVFSGELADIIKLFRIPCTKSGDSTKPVLYSAYNGMLHNRAPLYRKGTGKEHVHGGHFVCEFTGQTAGDSGVQVHCFGNASREIFEVADYGLLFILTILIDLFNVS